MDFVVLTSECFNSCPEIVKSVVASFPCGICGGKDAYLHACVVLVH